MKWVDIRFTSDPEKAKRNELKHKITFKMAEQVFDDPFMLVVEDCEREHGEMRYHAIGRVLSQVLLVVVHTNRFAGGEEIIHIISAREAEDYEQRAYADQF